LCFELQYQMYRKEQIVIDLAVQETGMKIGVSGASGQLGKLVLAELFNRAAGNDIIGISRTPETVATPAEARFGDYDKPESLAKAYEGLDVLLLIPTVAMAKGVRAAQGIAAIDAALAVGVKHIVLMSATGARNVDEAHIWASYFATEQHLMRTARRWTILRMNYYAEAVVQEVQMVLAAGAPLTALSDARVAMVARQDVAAAAAGILTTDGHDGAVYSATGPESLSGTERAGIMSEIIGADIPFMVIPEEAMVAGLTDAGLPADLVHGIVTIHHGFGVGGFDIVTGDVEKLSGRAPLSLKAVSRAAFAAS